MLTIYCQKDARIFLRMLTQQFIFCILLETTVLQMSYGSEEKNWDILYLLKKERDVTLTNDFTMVLKTSTNYSELFLSSKSIFMNNALPQNFFMILKLKFLNQFTSPGTIFSIADPDNTKRLSLTIYMSPGVIDKTMLNIIYHPVNREMLHRDIILPFIKHLIWTFAVSIINDKIIVYTNCEDTKRPFGYQFMKIQPQSNDGLFKDGAILNLFHEANGPKTFKGEIFELIFSNNAGSLQLLCPKPMVQGSGSKDTRLNNDKIGNVLLNPEKEVPDNFDDADNVLSDETFATNTNNATDTTTGQSQSIIDETRLDYNTTTKSYNTEFNIEINNSSKHYESMTTTKVHRTSFTSVEEFSQSNEQSDKNNSTVEQRTGTRESAESIKSNSSNIIDRIDSPNGLNTLSYTDRSTTNGTSNTNINETKSLGSLPMKDMSSDALGRKTLMNTSTERIITTGKAEDFKSLDAPTTEEVQPTQTKDRETISTRILNITTSRKPNLREQTERGNKEVEVNEMNVTEEKDYPGSGYNRCKVYIDQLMNMDQCEEMKQLRLSIPKIGEKGEKGIKGDHGEKGDIGPQGAQGICEKSQCPQMNYSISMKGAKGDKGTCDGSLCMGMKGDRGEKGDLGEKGDIGSKGESGSVNENNIELIKQLIATLLPAEIANSMGNYKGVKGEPGECKNEVKQNRESNNGQIPQYQENINIGYGSLVFENKKALEKVSFNLPLGSMVFLLKSDTFLVKVDHLNNIWRSISLESRSKDWMLPVFQTTPKTQRTRPTDLNGIGRKLYVVALSVATMGDLKSTTYQPGGYSGASFQCQQNGDIYGFGRLMHPLINTDMFNMKYIVNDMYKNIPIYNSRDQIIANDFQSLLSIKDDLLNDILDFDRRPIGDNVLSSCVWIGKDPIPEYRDYQQNSELKCDNWMTRHPLSQGLVTNLKPLKPLLSDENLSPRACSLQCHILCIQTEPHLP